MITLTVKIFSRDSHLFITGECPQQRGSHDEVEAAQELQRIIATYIDVRCKANGGGSTEDPTVDIEALVAGIEQRNRQAEQN